MRFLLTVVFFVLLLPASAQAPFADEIRAFKSRDSVALPAQGQILFAGSSSIRLWKDLAQDFPTQQVLNRGFGGSTFEDVLRYADDIILPYKPRHIVIYCGENDLAKGVAPDVVVEQFKELFARIRTTLPKTTVTYISIKPSPSRIKIIGDVAKTNSMIKAFLSRQKKANFVDVFSLMVDKNGNPREELFVEDRLHMNRKGYDIWKKVLTPIVR
jgi:lysophospholipase L1-like esterase